jgi:putative oxidoreductase
MKWGFVNQQQSAATSAAYLLLRMVAGTAFIFHGSAKIVHPFSWMGPGSSMPPLLQGLAALSEFGGGIAWILGLLVPLACFGIGATMSVALFRHVVVRGDRFVNPEGASYELAAVYFCVSLILLIVGPGRYSLDRLLFSAHPIRR